MKEVKGITILEKFNVLHVGYKSLYTVIDYKKKYDLFNKLPFIELNKNLEKCYHTETKTNEVNAGGYIHIECVKCETLIDTVDTWSEEKRKEYESLRFAKSHATHMKEEIENNTKKINTLKTKKYHHGMHFVQWNDEKQEYEITLNENAVFGDVNVRDKYYD